MKLLRVRIELYVSNRNIAEELNIHHQTILNHLKRAGYKNKTKKKKYVWAPYDLMQKHLLDCVFICKV